MKKTQIKHKLSIVIRVLFSVLLVFIYFQTAQGQNYDYLKSATATGNGITTNNSTNWSDLFSVTIDVTDVSHVLVTASINMHPHGISPDGREANYNIYRSDLTTDESGEIKQQMIKNAESGVESWRIGTLVHIFDVSSATGSISFMLKHSNQGTSDDGRNVESFARLTAVALTTASSAYRELSNAVKRIDTEESTASGTYAEVTGTTTNAITLPIKGDIFVTASINSNIYTDVAGTNLVTGEYKLESSPDGTAWSALGKPVKYTLVNKADDGIISLVGILQDQNPGINYQFRVAHRRVSGAYPLRTTRTNIAAVALAHNGGGYFPTFYSEIGTTGVDVDWGDDPESVTSSDFTAAANIGTTGPALFVSSQYLVDATNLDATPDPDERMRSGNQLYIDDGTTTTSALDYYYYIPDNVYFGAAGFTGLVAEMTGGGSYTIGMQHEVEYVSNHTDPKDEILTTSEVILCGFQTYDQPGYLWDGSTDGVWATANNWAYDVAPSASTHDVTIPDVTNDPIIGATATATCGDLFIKSGATLTVESTSSITTGSLIVEGTATGDVTVERFLTNDRWHYISEPVNDTRNFNEFLGLTPSDPGNDIDQFYWWDEDGTDGGSPGVWFDILNGSEYSAGSFQSSQGYAINYGVASTEQKISFSGVPYTENQTINITRDASSTNEGANLIGNPFCSTIALNSSADATNNFIDQNAGVLGASFQSVNLWNESENWNGSSTEDYIIISNSEGATFAAPGQAFMVVAATDGATINFNRTIQKHGSATFYKNTKQDEVPRFYMNVENDEGLYNEILIAFIEGMTKGLDPSYDAGKLKGNPNIALYTKLIEDNGVDFAHQALPPLNNEVVAVKTGLDVSGAGNYTFKIRDLQNFDEAISIKLEDKLTGSLIDFRNDEEYSFFINTPGEIRERFVLHFNGVTGIEDDEYITKAAIQTYASNNTLYILNPKMKRGTIHIFNVTGQEIANFQLTGNTKQQQTLNVNDIINIVQIKTDNEVISKKVIFK